MSEPENESQNQGGDKDTPEEGAPGEEVPVETAEELAEPSRERVQAVAPSTSKEEIEGEDAETQIRRMSRRSFLWAGVAVLGTGGALRWLNTRRTDDGIVWPLRRSLNTVGDVTQDLFSQTRLAPQWSPKRAREPRVNGDVGMGDDFDPATWKLHVSGLASDDMSLTLKSLKSLPYTEFTTELKCIEGWSVIVSWGGVRFSDFMKRYPPQTQSGNAASLKNLDDLPPYVGMSTPDGTYYVGLDREAALHPQTLLCTHMNGKPLTLEHGAPLRLVIPVKYGVKHIKRIGSITWGNERPADYWAEQGYDWYGGH